MSDLTISDLPPAAALDGTEVAPAAQGSSTVSFAAPPDGIADGNSLIWRNGQWESAPT